MPPFNRFAPSKYKNQFLDPAKPQDHFTELPSLSPSPFANSHSLACGSSHLAVSLGNSVGLVEWNEPRKYGGRINKVDVGGSVVDLVWSGIEEGMLGVVTTREVRVSLLRWEVDG
jgi:hypothetical protein